MAVVILRPPVQQWVCAHCSLRDATRGQANRFHPCSGLGGINAPMVLEGERSEVVVIEREDWIGRELVQYDDNGRPVMAVETRRWDGSNDVMVNAPTAQGAGGR